MSESTGTAVQESAGHPKSFPPLDPTTFPSQLLWLVITFGLLYILVRRVVSPRVGSVIEERKNRVKGDIALAKEIRRDTQLELARYTQSLEEARSGAGVVAYDLRQKVKLEVDTERAKIEAEIEARISEAEKRIVPWCRRESRVNPRIQSSTKSRLTSYMPQRDGIRQATRGHRKKARRVDQRHANFPL